MKSIRAIVIVAVGITACSQPHGSSIMPQGIAPPNSHGVTAAFKTLVEFNEINGCKPTSGLAARENVLYGTTTCGGRFAEGEVYSVTTRGKFHIVHNFTSDGKYAYAPAIVAGNALYGPAVGGGKYHDGTVYSLYFNGNERWLYSFKEEDFPYGGLAEVNGTLYGTTVGGGSGTDCLSAPGCGTVYAITSSGRGKTIYNFKGGNDGAAPWSGLINVNGTLYGVTSEGGGTYDAGTVFSVTTSGEEQVLHRFHADYGSYDGFAPFGALVYANGALYGTTESGGTGNWGTVFSITTSGQEQVVYSFGGVKDDAFEPEAGLVYLNGELYGTSYYGGGTGCGGVGCGTIFEVSAAGKEQVLYKFHGIDGSQPESQLAAINGVLYGTTSTGGEYYDFGTVFSLKP